MADVYSTYWRVEMCQMAWAECSDTRVVLMDLATVDGFSTRSESLASSTERSKASILHDSPSLQHDTPIMD